MRGEKLSGGSKLGNQIGQEEPSEDRKKSEEEPNAESIMMSRSQMRR